MLSPFFSPFDWLTSFIISWQHLTVKGVDEWDVTEPKTGSVTSRECLSRNLDTGARYVAVAGGGPTASNIAGVGATYLMPVVGGRTVVLPAALLLPRYGTGEHSGVWCLPRLTILPSDQPLECLGCR